MGSRAPGGKVSTGQVQELAYSADRTRSLEDEMSRCRYISEVWWLSVAVVLGIVVAVLMYDAALRYGGPSFSQWWKQ